MLTVPRLLQTIPALVLAAHLRRPCLDAGSLLPPVGCLPASARHERHNAQPLQHAAPLHPGAGFRVGWVGWVGEGGGWVGGLGALGVGAGGGGAWEGGGARRLQKSQGQPACTSRSAS